MSESGEHREGCDPTERKLGGYCQGCAEAAPDDGWTPGCDDPEPRELGNIDTGDGWPMPPLTVAHVPGEDREVTIWRDGFAAGLAARDTNEPKDGEDA